MNRDELLQAIEARHSVRSYKPEKLSSEMQSLLQAEIAAANEAGNLDMRLMCGDTHAFDSTLAHYGKFSGVANYIIVAGFAASDMEERAGYWGEKIVLYAQHLGLNTCWVALTFRKRHVKTILMDRSKLAVVIAIGEGLNGGAAHAIKSADKVSLPVQGAPEWFSNGVKAALLAPTAMNQQSFFFTLSDEAREGRSVVKAESKGGFYSKVDLGIAKLHFEIGAGTENFVWA